MTVSEPGQPHGAPLATSGGARRDGQAVPVGPVRHVVVDIEGTTSRSTYVYEVLFPYATQRFDAWLRAHADDPTVQGLVSDMAAECGDPDASHEQIVAALTEWVAQDRKVTPLKTLQGLIWQEGFDSGELVSDFYPDALIALRAWHEAGLPISVYSSGSVLAQRNWYAHTPEGDLTPWIAGYYDTANAGPKRDSASYQVIAEAMGVPLGSLLFCSDVVAELDAASDAGWQVVRVRRPGEAHVREDSAYPEVADMTAIRITR